MSKLQRYGLEWKSKKDFICHPMKDGYWTPWHIADNEITTLRQQLEQAEQENERVRQANLDVMMHFEDMKAAKEQAEARAIEAVRAEPELEDDMPEEMWQALRQAIATDDRELVMAALRITVQETKKGIIERLSTKAEEQEKGGGDGS